MREEMYRYAEVAKYNMAIIRAIKWYSVSYHQKWRRYWKLAGATLDMVRRRPFMPKANIEGASKCNEKSFLEIKG